MAKRKDPRVGTGKKPKGSGRRLYTDENPKDTVRIKYATPIDICRAPAGALQISDTNGNGTKKQSVWKNRASKNSKESQGELEETTWR